MSYQVLARKYRPKNFDELVGQEVLVTTLRNAIANKKIAHSFILNGIRGVGKTTTARIIAKSLNCIGEDGQALEARESCGTCSNCVAISNSNHQDVIEIDAASKTGVDDVRAIIESTIYSPAISRYKVYIIDEIHMLSNNAFNALLKTLEEPPSHIKFIFATTEIRKIPITILSRCQRFDLRRLSNQELANHLENILHKEGFAADINVLNLIAEAADGSARDLLSITDRILSLNNYQKEISENVATTVLNLSDTNQIIDLLEYILAGDSTGSIVKFNKFYEISTDILSIIIDLQKITHIITLKKTIGDYKINSIPDFAWQRIIKLAQNIKMTDLVRIWQMLMKGATEIANSSCPRITMEMLLIRMCYLSSLPNLEKIINSQNNNIVDIRKQNSEEKLCDPIQNQEEDNKFDNLTKEVKRNFPNSKIINNTKDH